VAVHLKSAREIALMREAGRVAAITLLEIRDNVKPGVTTAQLDDIAERMAAAMGAIPSFKGYNRFPASLCSSINDEIVHGIPSPQRVLHEGDIVSLDFGAILKGYHGDAAITVGVGHISPQAQKLLDVTAQALQEAIRQVRAGNHLTDIGHAVETYAQRHGFSVVRQYVGHGIGRRMHEEPQVPNFGPPHQGPVLKPGMVLAIEPMVNTGTEATVVLPDKWTVITADGGLSAHFEHTVAVTSNGPEILTLP
jgi:methionyl aminopeptidase